MKNQRVKKELVIGRRPTYTIRPREHGISGLRTSGEQIIPPYGSGNSGLPSSGPKHAAILALGELSTLIIKVFCMPTGQKRDSV